MRAKGLQNITTMMGTGCVRVAGLHELGTVTGTTSHRAQLANDYARLERDRVHLLDRLSAQALTHEQTEDRLRRVCKGIAKLERALGLPGISGEAGARPAGTSRRATQAEGLAAMAARRGEDDSIQPLKIEPFKY